jgi:D-beta-D-heptose 7-phosphate kinase/D-beta-D-heptose 1-phosphate adenosyltransferase
MKILVVGDTCIDIFYYGDCKRLCPEGPVPVFNPIRYTSNRGMSGNVVENIKSLGYDCDHLCNTNRITKTRYVDEKSNQLLLRVDEDDIAERIKHTLDYSKYDLIIISDYCKGFLYDEDIKLISRKNPNVFLDSKKKITEDLCKDITFIKINDVEYEATKDTLTEWCADKLIVTKGMNGCEYKGKVYNVPKKIETIDISGAGDTFMAGFCTKMIETSNIDEAIMFAQECTSKVIQKKGVSVINNDNG